MGNGYLHHQSHSPENTLQLGEKIGLLVEPGQIILLAGELGSGKTLLVKGIAGGLGIEDDVTSPTYNLINEYEGQLPLYHLDLYRLDDEIELYNIGLEEYIERDGIIVIEWPEIAYNLIPPDFLYIKIEVSGKSSRNLKLEAEGNSESLLEGLAEYVSNGD